MAAVKLYNLEISARDERTSQSIEIFLFRIRMKARQCEFFIYFLATFLFGCHVNSMPEQRAQANEKKTKAERKFSLFTSVTFILCSFSIYFMSCWD